MWCSHLIILVSSLLNFCQFVSVCFITGKPKRDVLFQMQSRKCWIESNCCPWPTGRAPVNATQHVVGVHHCHCWLLLNPLAVFSRAAFCTVGFHLQSFMSALAAGCKLSVSLLRCHWMAVPLFFCCRCTYGWTFLVGPTIPFQFELHSGFGFPNFVPEVWARFLQSSWVACPRFHLLFTFFLCLSSVRDSMFSQVSLLPRLLHFPLIRVDYSHALRRFSLKIKELPCSFCTPGQSSMILHLLVAWANQTAPLKFCTNIVFALMKSLSLVHHHLPS